MIPVDLFLYVRKRHWDHKTVRPGTRPPAGTRP
jgi:hypothetical protein